MIENLFRKVLFCFCEKKYFKVQNLIDGAKPSCQQLNSFEKMADVNKE